MASNSKRVHAGLLFIVTLTSLCINLVQATMQLLNMRKTLFSAAINIFRLGLFQLNLSSKAHYIGLQSIEKCPRKIVLAVLILVLSSEFKITSSAGELPHSTTHHKRYATNPSASPRASANLVPNNNGTLPWDLARCVAYCRCHPGTMLREEVNINDSSNTNADDLGGNRSPSCWTRGTYLDRKALLDFSLLKNYLFCDRKMSHTDCESMCRGNCNCSVYASVFEDGTGCAYWEGKLKFVDDISSGENYKLISGSDIGESPTPSQPITPDADGDNSKHGKESNTKRRWWWLWFLMAIGLPLAVFLHGSLRYSRAKSLEASKGQEEIASKEMSSLEMGTWIISSQIQIDTEKFVKGEKLGEFYSFSYSSILAATNNFSPTNKLGQGGFGSVYKGVVHNGQEIAVKKLSTRSSQGVVEFKNEITLIAKLQHTNLVRLLGFCKHRKEKLLVYEFMSNKSLDLFLFDPAKREILNWKKRQVIIEGIAQGLLYLHKYSRLKVIHRDLKTSNILLDKDMNPKISDFGIARMFDRNESEASTNRIVGTYGYMSPEYAMEGIFSEKSDVFSFGVILAEIISGKRNTSFSDMECGLNLVGYAWGLWKEGKSSELIDPTMTDSCSQNEFQRCIHVALLCVQDSPADRPTMSDVVSMLANENIRLSAPKRPAFCFRRSEREFNFNKDKSENCSLNYVTNSPVEAR